MSTLGERIKNIRESLNLTGEEFGKKLNVTKVAVSNWENNNRKPDADMLIKIAELGNVTTDYLLARTNEKKSIISEEDITVTRTETENLAEDFLDMLIKHKKIKTKKDLTPQNILKLLNEIFDEIDKE